MKVLKEIYLSQKNPHEVVSFGLINNKQEMEEMFRLRYEVYLKMGYISKEMFPEGIEKDKYDEEGKCDYFIAKFNNRIIGSARVIKDYYLPTEKDCFKFEEPISIKTIPRNKRGEISRLIVVKMENYIFPSPLIILGIFDSIIKIAFEKDLRGGYSFIKESLRKKLKRIKIPFHPIKSFRLIYSKKHLWGYFYNPKDSALPVYYLRDEGEEYLDKIFNNKRIFKKINSHKFLYQLKKPETFISSLVRLWR